MKKTEPKHKEEKEFLKKNKRKEERKNEIK